MSLFRLLALLFPFSQKERAPAVPFQVPEIADSDAPDLLELAQQISELTKQIANYYDQNQKPKPTFGAQSPAVPETPEYGALRAPLNDAANDLLRLVNGPKSSMRSFLCTHYDLAAYQVALECNFFEIVPKIGMALADLAKAAAMDEDRAGRIMKFLTTQRVFAEVGSNMFEHTATSMLFARDSELKAAALMQ
jgi:hypothetical protein